MSVLNIFHPGGIAGAASRITGAMAKGVAAITMDEEYQQKRRETMNKQPSGLKEGLTRGGKGLVSVRTAFSVCTLSAPRNSAMTSHLLLFNNVVSFSLQGFVSGITGIVTKPIKGMLSEFVKTL